MKSLTAFIQKEIMELYRTGKLFLVTILFVLFGIMNPAIAKLTPWIMEMSADALKESGMVLEQVTVDAMTSWTQYYKNMSMVLIVFVILFSSILTSEYQRGTLVNMLTKGLKRWKVIAAKAFVVIAFWSICYWMYYGITYGYTAYFWDTSIVSHLFVGALCPYLFGIWLLVLILVWSAVAKGNIAVLGGTAGMVAVCYLIGMFSKVGKYLPIQLLSSSELLIGAAVPSDYLAAILVTIGISVLGIILAVLIFNRKNI